MIYRLFFCFLISFATLSSLLEAVALERITVKNAVPRQAVCNDGSPAVYYYRKGFGQGSNTWVIILGGGGFCYSVSNCNARQVSSPELMTSLDKPSTLTVKGILSESSVKNPDFFNANHVAIPYCSSDLWSGNREAGTETGGHEFRGSKIVRAVVADLKSRAGNESLSSAIRILFSGTSAGGVGVMVHLDWLAHQFPNAAVRGVNDAGWTPDLLSYLPISSQLTKTEIAIQLWNGQTDRSCAQANPRLKIRCFTSGVYPYLQAPLFVQMSQHDSVFLAGIGVRPPFDSSESFLANLFASAVRDSLQPVGAALSPRTSTHGVLPYNKFVGLKVNGHSLRELLGTWFFDRAGPVKAIE
jgi:O-palmitoleoyl-L-serine hydrolase